MFDPQGIGIVIFLVLIAVLLAAQWQLFVKAGKPGWAGIIPIYNLVVLMEIIGKPVWWVIVIVLVPCVGFVFMLLACIELAKVFGKDPLFGVGIFFLSFIFVPILAFGDARYRGPSPG